MSTLRGRSKEPDEACAQATDLARLAAEDLGGAARVGEYLGAAAEADRVVTHRFVCLDTAYHGWVWSVTVARASRSKVVTVDEVLLLPGPDAILAPDWVPWRERVRPGDLGVGDLLPAPQDDVRLVPAVSLEGDDGVTDWGEEAWAAPGAPLPTEPEEATAGDQSAPAGDPAASPEYEPASDASEPEPARTGTPDLDTVPQRARVLSATGRDETALRWYTSEHGPKTPLAHAAPAICAGCGFFIHLGGPLGRVFGVCANEYAPDDGRVVSVDHGCGAHSEAAFPGGGEQVLRPVIDELGYDVMDLPGVSVDETVFEPLDHN